MNANIGHGVQPGARGGIDRLIIRELQPMQEVFLHIADAAFDPPFLLRLTRATGADLKTMVLGKIQIAWIERDGNGRAA
jgi:hypothetical protein